MTVLGLLGAMDEEIALLLADMQDKETVTASGISFTKGSLLGKQVVVCRSGVGKVNAAVTTQVLIDRFGVNAILFTGVAGAAHPDLNIGDIVISSSCQQHDMDVTALGFAKGVIPYQSVSDFPADDRLIKLAEEACGRICKEHKYVVGKVLSGDQFIADHAVVRSLYEDLNGVCVEMEGSAVAQVSHMNGIPYVVLRSMSDKADGTANVNFAEFTVEASRRSYEILSDIVGHM
ncbi:5'-methylthioadenosine/adenosylhomocysteine nucleosidase [Paenibacillus sp. J22TS3]|uniref:5'-methylthioadenosine/adenosylhomocysteine nucleosidase n=1 Tax=Paenibacillus sp. J22TS3 TaxID=2807192 RepID=UPI001B040A2E|nr:5'-methylthioadenosine/adenosylhomocysteine nucleosidase [Paenibacillus sp. J22TS3]GIP20359.1 5'-methylthioadenosine/S-adenosylhomocysteine nucleosidase [Paenibacillus sp. J22TS3]